MNDLIVNRFTLPDWHPTSDLVMVYPFKLAGREHIIPFYNDLLKFIPSDIRIILLVKDISIEKKLRRWCAAEGINNEIEFLLFPSLFDIWVKDFAPLITQEQGINIPVKFLYRPSYVERKYKNYVKDDDQIGEIIGKKLVNEGLRSVEFKWDMGNLTHNGKGTAIISYKFITDNQHQNIEHELKPILHVFCGFSNIIFIPTEKGDETGHVDGMVRFIDEKVVLVGEYPRGSGNDGFMNTLSNNLSQDLGEGYKIIRLMNGEGEDYVTEGLASALGNHMNFLRLGNKLLMPYYGKEISHEPIEKLKQDFVRKNINIEVIPVDTPEIINLARLGGVLNCITWQVYDR